MIKTPWLLRKGNDEARIGIGMTQRRTVGGDWVPLISTYHGAPQ